MLLIALPTEKFRSGRSAVCRAKVKINTPKVDHRERDDYGRVFLYDMAKDLYFGTLVHSLGLNELEVAHNSAIGVENGKIVFVEKEVEDLEAVKKAHGFEGVKVFLLDDAMI